jgi:hypothetical protein
MPVLLVKLKAVLKLFRVAGSGQVGSVRREQ